MVTDIGYGTNSMFLECGCNITAMSFLEQPTSILPWRMFFRENLNLLLTNFTALSSYPPKDYCVGWKDAHSNSSKLTLTCCFCNGEEK